MINFMNKVVGFVVNPLFIGMMMVVAGAILIRHKEFRAANWSLVFSLAWFWFWSMPIVGGWLCIPLEEDFPVALAEDMPKADAIVLLGGGIGGCTNYPYADLGPGADRAWHAARLWKAGKAPIIIPSNEGAELADIKLLMDLGVPRDAVILENRAVNTEENAKFVANLLAVKNAKNSKILLVTSAYHMRRSLYMFQKYAPKLECVPVATDYQALPSKDEPFKWYSILPNIGAFARNNDFVHEYLGYCGYKWFRK